MKKKLLVYAACWAVMLALFNVIVFVTPNEIGGVSKFTGGFWIGYAFTTATFIGQLICAFFALKETENRKVFYNIPVIRISYGTLIITLIVGGIFMAIPILPAWIAAVVCSIVLVFGVIAVVKARAAAEVVFGVDEKIAVKTVFIKELTARANVVMTNAATPELKAEAKRVYEAIRFSDPMSNEKLTEIEKEIVSKFDKFSTAMTASSDSIGHITDELIMLIGDRNEKCKLLK